MARWEYCAVVGLERERRSPGASYPAVWYFASDGVKIVEIKGQELALIGQMIARLGEEGWEMVSAAGLKENWREAYAASIWFKRQKN